MEHASNLPSDAAIAMGGKNGLAVLRAYGPVMTPEEVAALLSKLAPEPVAQPVVVEAAPVVAAPAEEQAEINFAETDKPSEDE